MPNPIPVDQNSSEQIKRLTAVSRAYKIAKTVSGTQCLLAISAIVVAQIAYHCFPGNQDRKALAAVYSFIVLYINTLLLESWRDYYQRTAARIQEIFDTTLYNLDWNTHRVGKQTATEEINGLVRAAKNPGFGRRLLNKLGLCRESKLEDWYPTEVGRLPLEYARFVCQRASLYWDVQLRRNLALSVKVLGCLLTATVVLAWVYFKLDSTTIVITVLAPTLPMAAKVYRDIRKHEKSADIGDRARSLLESSWNDTLRDPPFLSPDEMAEAARRVQDELYDRRVTSPMVPEWFYRLYRKGFEEDMNEGAQDMISEAESRLASP